MNRRFSIALLGFAGLAFAAVAEESPPVWSGGAVAGDPLFFVLEEDGASPPVATLLFTPDAPPVLKSATGETVYEPGRDYEWKPGSREITLTVNTRVPFKKRAELYPPEGSPNSYRERRDGKTWMLFGEGRFFHDLQSVADYQTSETWTGPVPQPAPDGQLGALREKLRRKEPLKLVTLGDSISTGANASGPSGAPPMQPGYPDLVARGLEERFGGKVDAVNLSVGGMAAPWGVEQIPAVLSHAPDLVLCAFGMNDASGRTPVERYTALIGEIVTRIRAARPDCAVIVISPMTANPEWVFSAPDLYPAYAAALKTLAGPGCAAADVTSVWTFAEGRKSCLSLTGNGLNHPNDFGHRLYADVVLAVIGGKAEQP